MTEILEHFIGGTSRSAAPWRKTSRTKRLFASLSLVFVIAAFLCAGCDDEAQIACEKEAAAIEDVIRQVNAIIHKDFPEKQPETYVKEVEEEYRDKIKTCVSSLRTIELRQCPLDFRLEYELYVQAVDRLFNLYDMPAELSNKKTFDPRNVKRTECLLQIKKAKNGLNLIAAKYDVAGRVEPISEGGIAMSESGNAPDVSSLFPVDNDVNEKLCSLPCLIWGIWSVSVVLLIVCLILLVLICLRGGRGKKYSDEQTTVVANDRNDLMLELADLCYRHGEYSECIRHLVNAKRLGLKEAERMYSRFLDDSKEFRNAADVYQFLEKQPRPS